MLILRTWIVSTDGIAQQTSGLGVRECALKEGLEEANLDADYAGKRMVSAGIVTILYDHSRGIYPCGEFVFDVELDKVCTYSVVNLKLKLHI